MKTNENKSLQKPQKQRVSWTLEEDNHVSKLIEKYGKNWGLISSII